MSAPWLPTCWHTEGSSLTHAVAVADQTQAQHFYKPNRPLALLERAQAAIDYIADYKSASSDMEGSPAPCPPLHIHIAQQASQIPV